MHIIIESQAVNKTFPILFVVLDIFDILMYRLYLIAFANLEIIFLIFSNNWKFLEESYCFEIKTFWKKETRFEKSV